MAKTMIQEGKMMTYTNAGGAIASGDVVVVGNQIGVAAGAIPTNESGELHMEGVFELPKSAGSSISQGSAPRWDASAGAFAGTGAPATGDVTDAVTAWATAASGDTVVQIKLNTGKGTVT